MFKKILVANRGEIAVRIIRVCREMDIIAVALYEAADISSLHVRLADVAVPLTTAGGFMDGEAVLAIARQHDVDAIHPGYGFLAEDVEFIAACEAAGIAFIGPPLNVVTIVRNKIQTLARASAAGFPTVQHSPVSFGPQEMDALPTAVEWIGYPIIIKSCRGGRGRAERVVRSPRRLPEAVRQAQAESQSVYGDQRIYLEKAILPAHQIGVQVLGDGHGNLVHLGEREGSVLSRNQKIIEESPSPALTPQQRQEIRQTALDVARLFNYQNAGTVEFLLDGDGRFYFTEIKARIQVEHTVTEMLTGIDLVREQTRIAAGLPLSFEQADVALDGWGMMARIHAEDPWNHYLPSPGQLSRVRFPGGPGVRIDTYVYCKAEIPPQYDPLIAKVTVRAGDRATCLARLECALQDVKLVGTPTNLALLQSFLADDAFAAGHYDTSLTVSAFEEAHPPDEHLRDLAAIAAVLHVQRNEAFTPVVPERLHSGWHYDSRRLPS